MNETEGSILDGVLGEDPGLDDVARALRAVAGALEDLARLVETFRAEIKE